MSMKEWSDREDDGRRWLIYLEFTILCVVVFGLLVVALLSAIWPDAVRRVLSQAAIEECHDGCASQPSLGGDQAPEQAFGNAGG